jgi:predicted DNA-binding transcriptional regulator AlpA
MLPRGVKARKGRDGTMTSENDGGAIVMNEPQNVLSEAQAARYCGVSPATLRLWRTRGTGPTHFRAGQKLVRYRRTDLDRWIESRLSQPSA